MLHSSQCPHLGDPVSGRLGPRRLGGQGVRPYRRDLLRSRLAAEPVGDEVQEQLDPGQRLAAGCVQGVQRAVRYLAVRQDVDQGAAGEVVLDQADREQADAARPAIAALRSVT